MPQATETNTSYDSRAASRQVFCDNGEIDAEIDALGCITLAAYAEEPAGNGRVHARRLKLRLHRADAVELACTIEELLRQPQPSTSRWSESALAAMAERAA